MRLRLTLALGLVAAACSGDKRAQPRPGDAAPASAGDAGYAPSGVKPAGARRDSAPPEIEASAIALGAKAPELDLVSTAGRWRLGDELGRRERVLLVLYRGDW